MSGLLEGTASGSRCFRFVVGLWLLLLVVPQPSRGLAWTQSATPPGGQITALAQGGLSSSPLYAGTPNAGIFVSSDGGASWTARGHGLAAGTVSLLAVDPQQPERAFAAVASQGSVLIFHSENFGGHWSEVPGANSAMINALVVDPIHRGRVYAATDAGLVEWQVGISAARVVGFAGTNIMALAIDPRNGSLYAAVEDPNSGEIGFQKSADGRHWKALQVPYAAHGCWPLIVLDPSQPATLYVTPAAESATAFQCDLAGGSILKSGDGGTAWMVLPPVPTAFGILALVVAPDGALYAATLQGVVHSNDGGRSWSPRLTDAAQPVPPYDSPSTSPPDSGLDVMVSPAAGTVYLAGSQGVWKTTDGGDRWAPASWGVRAQQVYNLAAANDPASTVFAGLASGVFRSRDGGQNWRRVTAEPLLWFTVAPSDPQRLYADSDGTGYRSDDGGSTWTEIFAPPYGSWFTFTQAVDPQNENIFYRGGYFQVGTPWEGYSPFVMRSEDGGITWTDVSGPFTPLLLTIDPQRPRTLFTLALGPEGDATGSGFFKSLDAGASWEKLGSGLPLAWPDNVNTYLALAVDPAHPEVVYAGLPEGIWRSSDGGISFSAMNCGLATGQVGSILVTPGAVAPLYAGLPGLGVWAWDPSSQCWTPLNSGLPTADFTGTIVWGAQGVLIAGTFGNGLWRLGVR